MQLGKSISSYIILTNINLTFSGHIATRHIALRKALEMVSQPCSSERLAIRTASANGRSPGSSHVLLGGQVPTLGTKVIVSLPPSSNGAVALVALGAAVCHLPCSAIPGSLQGLSSDLAH